MRPLIDVATDLKVDYQRLRSAAIRGEVSAQRVKGRWWVDQQSAARWQRTLSPVPNQEAAS